MDRHGWMDIKTNRPEDASKNVGRRLLSNLRLTLVIFEKVYQTDIQMVRPLEGRTDRWMELRKNKHSFEDARHL